MFEDVIISLVGWSVMLGAALWYANRKRHPSRGLLSAFGIFCGILGGISFAGLIAFVAAWFLLGFEGTKVPGTIGAVLALGVVIPAWRLAVARISRPPNRT